MNQQRKTDNANPVPSPASPPASDVRDRVVATTASNDASVASERIRALEALAQCMLDAGLGG
jgi:hypothetical protein